MSWRERRKKEKKRVEVEVEKERLSERGGKNKEKTESLHWNFLATLSLKVIPWLATAFKG